MTFANVTFYKNGPVSPCSRMLYSAMLQVAFLFTKIMMQFLGHLLHISEGLFTQFEYGGLIYWMVYGGISMPF